MHIFHDWIIVERDNEININKKIKSELSYFGPDDYNTEYGEYGDKYITNGHFCNKICSVCGKIDNFLDKYKNECRDFYKRRVGLEMEKEEVREFYKKLYDEKVKEQLNDK
jgi:hypothetical protein